MIFTVAAVLAALAGMAGLVTGVAACQRATRAVRECRDLALGADVARAPADPRALRDIAIVRYDALNEMSGQLSFSLALLNAAGDGVVLSSINGRAETRTYAKPIQAGQGDQELSPEEAQAVHFARLGTGLSSTPPVEVRPGVRPRRAAATA